VISRIRIRINVMRIRNTARYCRRKRNKSKKMQASTVLTTCEVFANLLTANI
jgi:hypothetical protein